MVYNGIIMGDIMNSFDQVSTFLQACGQTVDEQNSKQSDLYMRLIEEEYNELLDANRDQDSVEELDACCDLIWVTIGYALSRGWDISGAFNEVARSNMSKVDSATGKVLKREDGKILKPATFSEPQLKSFLNNNV